MKQENSYILNLEGSYIYKSYYEQFKEVNKNRKTTKELKVLSKEDRKLSLSNNETIKENIKDIKAIVDITYINKLYTATIPYSLETKRMGEYFGYNSSEFTLNYRENKRQETKLLINVNFENAYKVFEKIKNKKGIETSKSKLVKTIKKKNIRKHLYNSGFYLPYKDKDGNELLQHYVVYKRGASKAKTGSVLFIKDEHFEYFKDRSRLGLKFEKDADIDLCSIWAYESLIMSGIDFTIELDPKTEILLIDDIYGKEFESKASVTKINEKGEIETKNEEHYKSKNCLTDGQSLMDEAIFNNYYFWEVINKIKVKKNIKKHYELKHIKIETNYYIKSPKSMMLLRNDWLKSNAINCRLHKFLMDYAINGKVTDMLRGEMDASKIKIVITPNSLKWLKLKDHSEFKGSKKACYEYWLDKIENEFGVVKQDKEGNFGSCNRLTYQLTNSLNLSKDEVRQLCQEELEYIKLLKNDTEVFKDYVATRMCMLDMEEALECTDGNEDYINYVSENDMKTSDMINNLLASNNDFQHTNKFADWRYDQIQDYIENCKKAKLRLKDTKYCTIVSNPYEFLLATVGKYEEGKSICEGREVWCSYYDDAQKFCISRNPHINIGNVMYGVNKSHKEYLEWFNFSENMIIVNINDNDMPSRGQGFDEDSDTLLILPSKLLYEKALDSYEYFTPMNGVKGEATPRKNNMDELAALDDMLANNLIGQIINSSAIYNSYMNQAIHDGSDKDTIDRLFNCSSALSSLSQIELDRSKKSFDNINLGQELKKIKKATDKNGNSLIQRKEDYLVDIEGKYKRKKIKMKKNDLSNKNKVNLNLKGKNFDYRLEMFKISQPHLFGVKAVKTIVPNFFNVVAKYSEFREYKAFNTPMDYLQEILGEEIDRKIRNNTTKEFKDLLVKECNLPKNIRRSEKHEKDIFVIVEKYSKELNKLKVTKSDKDHKTLSELLKTDEAIASYKRNRKKEALKELAQIKINAKTILQILIKCYDKKGRAENKINEETGECMLDIKGKPIKVKKWSNYAVNTMNLLYEANTKDFLMCFKTEHTENNLVLIESENGDVSFWNKKYKKIGIKEFLKKCVA